MVYLLNGYMQNNANTWNQPEIGPGIEDRMGKRINWGFANVMTKPTAAYANMCNGNSI